MEKAMLIAAVAMISVGVNAADTDSAITDTHVLRARVVGGAAAVEDLKDAVVKAAQAQCAKQQRVAKVRSVDTTPDDVRVTFSCLAPDDPELGKK